MKRKEIAGIIAAVLGLMAWLLGPANATPMGTAWTYQGRLMDDSSPADGLYDFQFKLFDDPCTGSQEGSTIDVNELDVIAGYFTVELDFGAGVFDGDARWLDISVRPGKSSSSFTSLGPRQRITSTPYSLQTRGIFVDNAGNVGMGTTSPGQELHVYQPIRNVYVRAESDGGYAFFQADGTENSGLRIEENGTLKANVYWNTASQCLSLAYGNNDSLVVKDKNVGIGTKNPSNDLHVYDSTGHAYVTAESENGYAFFIADGSNNSGLTIKENGTTKANVYWNTANDSLSMAEGGVDRFVVKGGKVGIGTTGPGAKLDVSSPGTGEDAIIARGSSGHEIFEVTQDGSGNGKVFVRDSSGGTKIQLSAYGYSLLKGGNVGIGDVGIPLKKLVVRGNILVKSESTGADVLELGQGLDYAEGFNITEEIDIEPGTVLVIDSENPGKLTISQSAYDSKVAGIVAGANGIGSGVRLGVGQFDYDVALAGRVYCKVDATEEAVHAGDQLTTSGTAGHAMKAIDYDRARGAVLGKAMESLEKGKKGKILVLVTLQ